jgi:hypothetical protein
MKHNKIAFSTSVIIHAIVFTWLICMEYPISFHFGSWKEAFYSVQSLVSQIVKKQPIQASKTTTHHLEIELSSQKKTGNSKEGSPTPPSKEKGDSTHQNPENKVLQSKNPVTQGQYVGGIKDNSFAGWVPPSNDHEKKPVPKQLESTADGYNIMAIPKEACSKYFGGIGIVLDKNHYINEQGPRVTGTADGYPAFKAGIQVGDLILNPPISELIGDIGSNFVITFIHNNKVFNKKITREKVCYRANLNIILPKK